MLVPEHMPMIPMAPPLVPTVPAMPLLGLDGLPRAEQLLSVIEDEEDDEEDVESVLERLPQDTKLLREYITASQGFLLLLNLRQHLKDLYGFSDAKISQYSPSESAKVYEKAVNRKNNQHFKPKTTLQRLQEKQKNDEELDKEGRRRLVKEYLDFKQLMLKFDPDDPEEGDDDDESGSPTKHAAKHQHQTNSSESDKHPAGSHAGADLAANPVQYQVHLAPEHPNNSMNSSQGPPRVPKLTIHTSHHQHHSSTEKEHHRKHRAHKTEKPKKHKKKKRRRLSDSSDSDDVSDPDFRVWVVGTRRRWFRYQASLYFL